MGYCFQPSARPDREVHRIFGEKTRHAIEQLRQYPDINEEGLHTARKDIKKLRSLLRLLRSKDFKEARKRLNRDLREVGRKLSLNRDREVIRSILLNWKTSIAAEGTEVFLSGVSKLVDSSAGDGQVHPHLEPQLMNSSVEHLKQADLLLQQTSFKHLRWSDLLACRERALKQLKRAEGEYLNNPDEETLHEWRKQLKNYLYQLLLLKKTKPRRKDEIAKAREVESCLGSARDLDLLICRLWDAGYSALSIYEMGAVITHAEKEKEKFLTKALKLKTLA